MHLEAYRFVNRQLHVLKAAGVPLRRVLEYGSLDVNGGVRELFGIIGVRPRYLGIDWVEGPGVDVVADASRWRPDRNDYDLVITTECFEHAKDWPRILTRTHEALRTGGWVLATMATDPREPHSCSPNGRGLEPDEWYENVDPDELRTQLHRKGFEVVVFETHDRGDLYALAWKVK